MVKYVWKTILEEYTWKSFIVNDDLYELINGLSVNIYYDYYILLPQTPKKFLTSIGTCIFICAPDSCE